MRKVINFEDTLVEAMQAGDESALGMVIDKYTAYVGTIVWNIIGSRLTQDDAKEIISDVFYTLWKNCSKVNQGKLKAYLGSISRSRAVDALRQSKQDISLDDDLVEISISGPEDNTVKAEEYAALRKALNAMPEPDYTIFIKHYYFYQKTNVIADQLGLNVNTVKARACLNNSGMHKWRWIFVAIKAIFCRNTLCISRKINAERGKKARQLGVSSFFKQALDSAAAVKNYEKH